MLNGIKQEIIEQSSTGIICYNPSNKEILYTNKEAKRIMPYIDIDENKALSEEFVDKIKNADKKAVRISNADKSMVVMINLKHTRVKDQDIAMLYLFDNTQQYLKTEKEKEEKLILDNLLKHSPSAICLFKWDGTTIRPVIIGNVLIKLIGLSIEEIMERTINDFFRAIHPEELFSFTAAVRTALYETKKLQGTYRLYNKDSKSYSYVYIEAICIPQEDGSQYISTCFTDMTKEKEKSKLLMEANEKIKLLYEHIPGGIFTCKFDKNFRLIYANDEFYSILGYNVESFRKIHFNRIADIMDEKDRDELETLIRERIKSQSFKHILKEVRFEMSNGNYKWVSLSGQVLEDEDANPYCYFVFVDINEFKEKQLKQEIENKLMIGLINNINCGIIKFNREKSPRLLYANQYAAKLLGYHSPDLMLKANNYLINIVGENSRDIIFDKIPNDTFEINLIKQDGSSIKLQAYIKIPEEIDANYMVIQNSKA